MLNVENFVVIEYRRNC